MTSSVLVVEDVCRVRRVRKLLTYSKTVEEILSVWLRVAAGARSQEPAIREVYGIAIQAHSNTLDSVRA